MKMIEISKEKFYEFVQTSEYNSFYQTENYGLVMKNKGFDYSFVAYTDNDENILATSMFLTKKIGGFYYAYCPRGYIINYTDTELVKKFTRNLKKYFKRKKVVLLKINPLVPIGIINTNNENIKENINTEIIDNLKYLGFKKRKETKPLELIETKLSNIINIKEFDLNSIKNDLKEKIEIANNSGLEIVEESIDKIDLLFKMNSYIKQSNYNYYIDLYNEFKKDNNAKLLFIKVNYESYLINAKKRLEKEQEKNDEINRKFMDDTSDEILKEKMKSDNILEEYKQDIIFATNGLKNNKDEYILGSLIIKYNNRITVLLNGINNEYYYLYPEYFLYYKLIEENKENFDILDLNEIADDFNIESIYYKMNKAKIDFNTSITEYIGELDLIISEWKFKLLEKNNMLSNEFNNLK